MLAAPGRESPATGSRKKSKKDSRKRLTVKLSASKVYGKAKANNVNTAAHAAAVAEAVESPLSLGSLSPQTPLHVSVRRGRAPLMAVSLLVFLVWIVYVERMGQSVFDFFKAAGKERARPAQRWESAGTYEKRQTPTPPCVIFFYAHYFVSGKCHVVPSPNHAPQHHQPTGDF